MKHHHDASANVDVNLNVDLPTQDLEKLIDKATDSAIKVILVATVASLIKSRWAR